MNPSDDLVKYVIVGFWFWILWCGFLDLLVQFLDSLILVPDSFVLVLDSFVQVLDPSMLGFQ